MAVRVYYGREAARAVDGRDRGADLVIRPPEDTGGVEWETVEGLRRIVADLVGRVERLERERGR